MSDLFNWWASTPEHFFAGLLALCFACLGFVKLLWWWFP